MNNITLVTIVGWDTRNIRRHGKIIAKCKDFGLKPILHNLYVGNLYSRERSQLVASIKRILTKQTDKFHLSIMCQSCFYSSPVDVRIKEQVMTKHDFELIQVPLPKDVFIRKN